MTDQLLPDDWKPPSSDHPLGWAKAAEEIPLYRKVGERRILRKPIDWQPPEKWARWAYEPSASFDRFFAAIIYWLRRLIPRPSHRKPPELVERRLQLLGYILTPRLRERVYTPAVNELIADWASARKMYRTRWARRWLNMVFYLRGCGLAIDCVRTAITGKAWDWLLSLVRTFRT